MVAITDSMMRAETDQRCPHSIQRGVETGGIEVCHGDSQVIAMVEVCLGQETALQPVDQSQDCSVVHFCSKEKRPPASRRALEFA